jgi:5-formyltetrahydrofolate cyclo-ligase
MPVPKREMRHRVKRLLAELPAEERRARSALIQAKLLREARFQAATVLAAYASFGTEVVTDAVLAECLAGSKTLLLPRMKPDGCTLSFHRVAALADLETNAFGIREPRAAAPEVAVETVDFLLVPGMAFSDSGERLGRGAGYYDRILARIPATACALAIAYDMQLFPSGYFETEVHDRRVQRVLTEAREIRLD